MSADEQANTPVVVTEDGQGRYRQTIRAGRHEWLADEPESLGGTDAGPAPYDLLLAGLGACTSITLRMYAERKGMALDKLSVSLRHKKTGDTEHFERLIRLEGRLTGEQRQRLLEIAAKCPVARTLSGTIKIESWLADEPVGVDTPVRCNQRTDDRRD